MAIKETTQLSNINILKKEQLDDLDLTLYPNQIFATTDEGTYSGGVDVTEYLGADY